MRVTVKGPFGFTKKERITHSQNFRKVIKCGTRLASRNFVLFLRENKNHFHRLGIVVKKEVGPVTFRNRIKRYVREFFRLHKHQIQGSLDIVIFIKKGCSIDRFKEAEEELKGLFIL